MFTIACCLVVCTLGLGLGLGLGMVVWLVRYVYYCRL